MFPLSCCTFPQCHVHCKGASVHPRMLGKSSASTRSQALEGSTNGRQKTGGAQALGQTAASASTRSQALSTNGRQKTGGAQELGQTAASWAWKRPASDNVTELTAARGRQQLQNDTLSSGQGPDRIRSTPLGKPRAHSMAAGYGNFRWRCGSTACCCKTGSGSGSSSSRMEAACLLHGVELLARVALDGDVPKFPRTVAEHCAPCRRKALH